MASPEGAKRPPPGAQDRRAYLDPGRRGAATPDRTAFDDPGGEPFYPGSAILMLAAVGIAAGRGTWDRVWAGVLTLTGFALSLGPVIHVAGLDLPGPFLLLRGLPGGALLRTPSRLGVLALLRARSPGGARLGPAHGGKRLSSALAVAAGALVALEAWPVDLAGLVRPFPRAPAGVEWLRSAAPGVRAGAAVGHARRKRALSLLVDPPLAADGERIRQLRPAGEHRCGPHGRALALRLCGEAISQERDPLRRRAHGVDRPRTEGSESWPPSSRREYGSRPISARKGSMPSTPARRRGEVTRGAGLLPFVFALSGAAALLFETLWFRQAGLALGNSVWAASLITASFMAGLAAGNAGCARWGRHVRRPVAVYAAVEVAVALSGVAIVSRHAAPHPRGRVRVATAGRASRTAQRGPGRHGLPAVRPPRHRDGHDAAAAGGGAGRRAAGVWTRARPPVRHGTRWARSRARWWARWRSSRPSACAVPRSWPASSTLSAAAGALRLRAAGRAARRRSLQPSPGETRVSWPCSVSADLAGAIVLALETVWFRLLLLFVCGTTLAFAIMLAVVLRGHRRRRAPRLRVAGAPARGLPPRARRGLRGRQRGGADLRLLPRRGHAPVRDGHPPARAAARGPRLRAVGHAVHPAGDGAARTCELRDRRRGRDHRGQHARRAPRRAAGRVRAPAGAGRRGLGLRGRARVRRGRTWRSMYALGPWTTPADRTARGRRVAWGSGLVLAVALALFPFGRMRAAYLPTVLARWQADGLRVVATREGLTETSSRLSQTLWGEPVAHRLVTNGFSMAATGYNFDRYTRLFAYWAAAVRPQVRHALLISYGVGDRRPAPSSPPRAWTLDVVDISRDVLELGRAAVPGPRHSAVGPARPCTSRTAASSSS